MTDIKLPPDMLDDTFGFHRTAEGRSFLREVYKSYLERPATPKDSKVALIIGDSTAPDEVERTKAALMRWRNGQGELWGKQAEKTERIIGRLEQLMMGHSEIAEVMSDQASDIHKRDVGSALEILIYGAKPFHLSRRIDTELRGLEGLFQTRQSSWGSNLYTVDFYTYYKRPEGCRFLLAHEFSIDSRHTSFPLIGHHRSGYAFPTGKEELYRFMIDHANPKYRVFEVLSEESEHEQDGALIRIYERSPHYVNLNIPSEADELDRKHITYTRSANRFIESYIEKRLWDIVI